MPWISMRSRSACSLPSASSTSSSESPISWSVIRALAHPPRRADESFRCESFRTRLCTEASKQAFESLLSAISAGSRGTAVLDANSALRCDCGRCRLGCTFRAHIDHALTGDGHASSLRAFATAYGRRRAGRYVRQCQGIPTLWNAVFSQRREFPYRGDRADSRHPAAEGPGARRSSRSRRDATLDPYGDRPILAIR